MPVETFACLCLSLSVSVCLCMSLSVSVCLCLSLSLSLCLSVFVSVCVFFSHSVSLSLSVYLCLSLSLCSSLSFFFFNKPIDIANGRNDGPGVRQRLLRDGAECNEAVVVAADRPVQAAGAFAAALTHEVGTAHFAAETIVIRFFQRRLKLFQCRFKMVLIF
jgi:hypothetical protein